MANTTRFIGSKPGQATQAPKAICHPHSPTEGAAAHSSAQSRPHSRADDGAIRPRDGECDTHAYIAFSLCKRKDVLLHLALDPPLLRSLRDVEPEEIRSCPPPDPVLGLIGYLQCFKFLQVLLVDIARLGSPGRRPVRAEHDAI